ncbi:MAG: SH3 domain-containing protein [Anaerococcus vaginalis]|uniref:SH3 domain-containing protein n=1 Tax=Anaerococcus vaginalis TaxID=33037 RepID=UPI00290FE310|nr:SH3 domain-containing protein [Anaerococcus vaginalis]MDU7432648.1 SH3 domain-containing protein [Anaerococcus vaginalis]
MTKIQDAVNNAIAIADNNYFGYSQYDRWGHDRDCSSLVIDCWQRAGVPVRSSGATYTGNMYSVFVKCGFKDVTNQVNLNNGYGLQYGDVLLNYTCHTAMYIGNYRVVEASIDENGGVVGRQKGDQTGREIWTCNYYNYPWSCVLRYVGNNKSTSKYEAPKNKRTNDAKFIKNEKWTGITQAECNVRTSPSTKSPIVACYGKNQPIHYDQVWEGDGYRWISYIGANSGQRRYVACRRLSGDTTPWIRF